MAVKEKELPLFRTRAEIVPESFNESENTIEVTFATEARAFMGWCWETLSFEAGHVRLDRINAGANVLDNHARYGSVKENILGVVVPGTAKIKNGVGTAKLKISSRPELEGLRQDIKDGILRNISCGYRIYKYMHTNAGTDETPEYTAIDWEPTEISFVSVPADFNASVRSENPELNQIEIVKLNSRSTPEMLENVKTPEQIAADMANAKTAEQTRAAGNTNPVPVPAEPSGAVAEATRAAIAAERTRAAGIREAVRLAGLDSEFAATLVDNGTPLDEARTQIITKFAEAKTTANPTGAHVVNDGERSAKMLQGIEGALMHRAAPAENKLEGEAVHFRGTSLIDNARAILELGGVDTRGLTPMEVATRALSTSDYPALLANISNKFLRRAYETNDRTWGVLSTQMSASDFKAITGVQFGGSTTLEKVQENGEFKQTYLTEGKESYKVETYGRIISISRQALVNDDLNGFTRASQLFGNAAATLEADKIWDILTGSVKMSDGKTVFHADRSNLATGAGSALSEASLNTANVALQRRTGLNKEKLNLRAKYLIVSPELELTALKLVSAIVAAKTGDVNVFTGRYEIIVEQRLSPTEWYLAAAPSQIDGIVHAYLNGQSGVYTETKAGFEVDGVSIKARLDFGAGILDWRGFHKNAGA